MPTSTRINERYEKREILGQGGMGVVWWAYDHSLKRDVSLKTIRDVRDKTALDLFRKECATLAGMAHPNIVEIYDVGSTEENGQNIPYFVMPLLRGSTLDQLIAYGSSRLSVERGVDILAHDHGLVHRDLKPSNIFVLQDDSVKIIDFGVAHLVDVHSTVKHAGTLLYMSPEQIMLKKPTPASDLFSLGVVAFEVMTRRRPFEATNREDLAQRILSEIPPPAYQVNSTISLPISQVIHKAMAKQPYQRFSSTKEFGEYLQKALRNEPIESFSPARIEPRIQRVKKALETGELEFASEIISELESEAMLHTELGTLRRAVDEAVRSRAIQQLLETARRRFEEEEYQLALQKVQEILNLDPSNTEAHTLRGDIENKRSSRQIEDWLRLARQHMKTGCDWPASTWKITPTNMRGRLSKAPSR
jgi:eukaryotic-like serine/threonine-protein kinase